MQRKPYFRSASTIASDLQKKSIKYPSVLRFAVPTAAAYQLNLSLNYRLSDHWRVSLGADSNGVIQRAVPQRGLLWQIAIHWLPE